MKKKQAVDRRRFMQSLAAGAAGAATVGASNQLSRATDFRWPAITAECRPWTYWWWMGSAVDQRNVAELLRQYRRAGLGGVHIIPIYGARGFESRYLDFLSPTWIETLERTCAAARALGLGVDLTTGTGWPFGGPWVGESDAAPMLLTETYRVAAGGELTQTVRSNKQPHAELTALMAYSEAGDTLDLAARVNAERRLTWTAPGGEWTLYALFEGRTNQQVKRAAPGGEGRVINYFDTNALRHYLARFDAAFANRRINLRAMYNDSYEVYESNWTRELFAEFKTRRGYDLRTHVRELAGHGDAERAARVRCDYRATIADLVLERFTAPWAAWARRHGFIARNQAHGAPANLLDLYAAVDIPETESFGPSRFPVPNLRVEQNLPVHFGKPEVLVMKFASSAAHLLGKKLVSSESCTWLAEHFHVALSQVKPEIDQLFVGGVNHVFFHGTTYSPADEPWPGWLFYASTNFGPSSSFWNELPELNTYIARCQAVLQSGRPDNDLLVYFPVYDVWQSPARNENLLRYLTVHNSEAWMNDSGLRACAQRLFEGGYSFDYISDSLLGHIRTAGGKLVCGAAKYQALLVPACQLMPLETLRRLRDLAAGGATIIFKDDLPSDVPGLHDLERRRQEFRAITAQDARHATTEGQIRAVKIKRGRFLLGVDDDTMLALAGVKREVLSSHGLNFVRRAHEQGHHYFITNLGVAAFDGWVALGVAARSVIVLDALRDRSGLAATRKVGAAVEAYLQLAPGESCVLRTITRRRVNGARWNYFKQSGEPVPLNNGWNIEFLCGGPQLPSPIVTGVLKSWTELGGDDAKSFSGTARYTTSFQKPAAACDEWVLDLGVVCESARVRLNGQDAGLAWSLPFRLEVGRLLRDGENKLEIEVTNLNANRLADMARRQKEWIKFYFVDLQYKPFNAARWAPQPSGLLGPVNLVPYQTLRFDV